MFAISINAGVCVVISSRPQTPPSHEEKWSGEPSQISWASEHFCDSATKQRSKQKKYGYLNGDDCCKGSAM